MPQPDDDQTLREQARKRMQDMAAETASGNRDPDGAGGGEGDPEDYQGSSEQG